MSTEREESIAWDRFGRFLQQSGTKSAEIADRNLRLWSRVSEHLKKDQYTADDMADDVARCITTAVSNLTDVRSMFTEDPARNAVAQPVATAFLLFDWAGTSKHRLLEPVRIEVGSLSGRGPLPQRARVEISGSREPLSEAERQAEARGEAIPSTEDGIERLRDRVVAYWDAHSSSYILADINRMPDLPATESDRTSTSGGPNDGWPVQKPLVPGVYDGIVYLTDPPALLASLRILVEGEPPAPPVVSEAAAQPVSKKTI